MEVKDQIKSRVPITEVASLYVDLKPAGKYFKALCPFHTEKTPSFYVNPEKNTFTCYGCNQFGDIFTMVQEIENISFPEAMNFLIEKFNIPVEKTRSHTATPTDIYAKINEIALNHFKDNLHEGSEGKKALEYLHRRGITAETIDSFSLGYALNRWDGLYNHLRQNSCDIAKSEELGLVIRNPQKNSVYDRFRGRIIFPIFSESGSLIAFGGRTIFDEPNKYLNSPDTPLYKKSHHLYGFNIAKSAVRESKSAILVEGYFDMVSLYQNGVQNVAASLGTALTENQIYLLKRFADTIYIYYDTDKAGIAAAIRAIEKMFEQSINPRIIASGTAKDPDDFIRQNGLKGFNQLLSQAADGFRFLVNQTVKDYDLKIPERKNQAVDRIMYFVEKIPEPIVRDEYTRMTADFFKVDENLLKNRKKGTSAATITGTRAKGLTITPAERIFLRSTLAMPELVDSVKGAFNDKLLSALVSKNIIRFLFQNYNPHTKAFDDYGRKLKQLSEAEQAEFMNIFKDSESVEKDETALKNAVRASVETFIDIFNKEEFKRIDRRIKIAERENNTQEALRLTQEKYNFKRNKYAKNRGGTVEIL